MYDILLQTSPEPIFIYDLENLKFLDMNEATLGLYGYSKEEFLHMDLTDLYAPEDIQTLIESSNNHVTENVFIGPFRHKRKDGNSILVKISKTSIDYNGRKAHFNLVKDVTNELEKEKNLTLYKYIFENSSDLILTTDIHGFITYANKSFLNKLGYSPSEVNKTPVNSFLSSNDKSLFNTAIFRAGLQNNKTISASLVKKSGENVKTQILVSPIRDFRGETDTFAFIIGIDEVEEKIVQITHNNSGGSQELDSSFLSHLFHEILTPINVIIGFGQELIDSIDNPTSEQVESTDIIQENQKMLLQIMDTAGEYAALAQGRSKIEPKKLIFVDLIEDIDDSVKKSAELNKVKFNYGKISSSLSFSSDKHKILTFITSYINFGMQLTKMKNIYLSAQSYDNDNFVISIKDDTSSITQELVSGLRDVFSLEENSIRQKYGFSRFSVRLLRKLLVLLNARTGLIKKGGIPSEYGIIIPNVLEVNQFNSDEETIEFEPMDDIPVVRPGKSNTNFKETAKKTIENTRPVETKITTVIDDEEPEEEASFDDIAEEDYIPEPKPEYKPKKQYVPSKKVQSGKIDLKNLACLYLEDQVDSQILFKVQMKDLKKIEVANSLEKAFPIIERERFDFIVMDINLQGEYNGLDALKIIRQLDGYESTPIIAVTAYVLPGDKEKFIAAGFSDFISKPVLRDSLNAALKNIL